MQNEIFQYYYEQRVQNTKFGTQLVVKEPKGVFVARKTNKGKVVVGCSFLRGDDVFNSKTGLNIARKNAGKTSSRTMTESQKDAYDLFLKRVERYFFPTPKDSYRKEWNAPVVKNPFKTVPNSMQQSKWHHAYDTPISPEENQDLDTKAFHRFFGNSDSPWVLQTVVEQVVKYLNNAK